MHLPKQKGNHDMSAHLKVFRHSTPEQFVVGTSVQSFRCRSDGSTVRVWAVNHELLDRSPAYGCSIVGARVIICTCRPHYGARDDHNVAGTVTWPWLAIVGYVETNDPWTAAFCLFTRLFGLAADSSSRSQTAMLTIKPLAHVKWNWNKTAKTVLKMFQSCFRLISIFSVLSRNMQIV